ncbi:sulfotransferase family 2 domain-containing protein [Roseivirga sp.]|uniref:sulfotransferase family 2 domain-containing protein n=1 Tax=Roseivirga sp. TaxID=1964215 RepID=UPI003B51DB2B
MTQQRKVAFIHIHRTGGSTISSLLHQAKQPNDIILSQHCRLNCLAKCYPEYNDSFFVFSMVRNPWERIMSWYLLVQSRAQTKTDFITFIDLIQAEESRLCGSFLFNQVDYLTPEANGKIANQIYRYENYEHDVKAVLEYLEMPINEIPKLNNNRLTSAYRDYYSTATKNLVSRLCEKDIDEFKYSF